MAELNQASIPLAFWEVRKLVHKSGCADCKHPLSPEHPVRLAVGCCGKGLQAIYQGDQTVFLCCLKCGKTILRIELANAVR